MTIEGLDRRAVLRGTALTVVGTTLAACGANDESTAAGSSAGSTADSIGGAAAPTTDSSGGLGAASAIPVGGGKIFGDQKVVVTQPTAGQFKAFSAVCTHQGCLVSQIKNSTIVCTCHGSTFSVTDGSVVTGPATAPLEAKTVSEAGGTLRLS